MSLTRYILSNIPIKLTMGYEAMNKDLSIIKSYANDSIQYGNRTNNRKAIARGKEVAFAVSNIESWVKELNGVISKMKSKAVRLDLLSPEKFNSYEEWLNEVENVTEQ